MAAMPSDAMTAAPSDGSDPTDPTSGAPSDGSDSSAPTVLLTVMDNHDGTYQLINGDEDDSDESSESGDGTASDTDDMGGDSGAQEGQQFDSIGGLLKGILDLVKTAESAGPDGSADDNFNAGFTGEDKGVPTKKSPPAMAQKY